MFPFIDNKKINISVFFISISLILYPATLLLVHKVNGLISALFALMGLLYLFVHRQSARQINKDETAFYIAVIIFFVVSLFVTFIGGFVYKTIGKHLHLVLAIPVYIYIRHTGFKLMYLWIGLVVGAVMSAGFALYQVAFLNMSRAGGITNPILFGNLALVMGCMSLAGLGWFKERANWQTVFPVVALLCGVLASVLSGSRGGWIAVPFIFILFLWYLKSKYSSRQVSMLASVVVLLFAVIYLVPQTKVGRHIDRTIASLQKYEVSEASFNKRETSVGARFEMWHASWKMFLDNPLVGVGWGHYQEQAGLQVDQGLRHKLVKKFDHPHSEYFAVLAQAGIIGFVALMLLFSIPARLFIKYIKYGKTPDTKRLALGGLVLIVAYMAFGVSEVMLYRSRSVNFFAFYLAVFMAGIYWQEKEADIVE